MSTRLGAHSSPPRHFWFWQQEADKVSSSPKGDQPGFVQVTEDGRMLFIPDRRGNNRIDGLKNLIEDSHIALIFFVPGVNETYRVNGRAQISQDADLKRRFVVNGRACDGYGRHGRGDIPTLCEGACLVRPMEGG
jgi:predicted pyridoxine 5'-phosphate oxidase superfamily flavin-nucleotide-binding protein